MCLRFEGWLRRLTSGVRYSKAAVDCADDFLDYLEDCRVSINGCCEADLRTYLYNYLPFERPFGIRRRPRPILGGLRRFVEYLEAEEGISLPWAAEILADEDTFLERWRTCPGRTFRILPLVNWRLALHSDLEARVFLPDDGMAGGGNWVAGPSGGEEDGDLDDATSSLMFALEDELARRWLVWREEVIAAGVTAPGRVRAILTRRQREWETRPHPGLGGETPVAMLRGGRKGG